MDLSRPLTDRHEICTQVWCGVKAETHFRNFFSPTPKKFGGIKPKLPQIIEDRRQSEARNFETAQHVNKQITCISSVVNALQNGTKVGAIISLSFDATYAEFW